MKGVENFMANISSSTGVFSLETMQLDGNKTYTDKIGYINDNILNAASSDTANVASDLWLFTSELITNGLNASLINSKVDYTAYIQGDD